ncbi:MAG: TolC family protein [Phycisphaerales bacterium]|nr:MAG: TolC family protein [Phycisphaerales bacterium]
MSETSHHTRSKTGSRTGERFRGARTGRAAALLIGALLAQGCSDPMRAEHREELRRAVSESAQRELNALRDAGAEPRVLRRDPGDLDFAQQRLEELETMGGPRSYSGVAPMLGPDLLDGQSGEIIINLESAIALAIEQNLDAQRARLSPAIAGAGVVEAEARFDWLFFSNVDWNDTSEPTGVRVIGGIPIGSRVNQSQGVAFDTGVRRPLTSGGVFQVRQGFSYTDNSTPGVAVFPDPANAAFLELGLGQPLLRGFGADVNLAEVRLARNLERAAIEDLLDELLTTVTETERAYWQLVRSRGVLLVSQRLLERGVETRDVLRGRLEFDVRPAEYSDAVARVESRRADVIRAQNNLRLASDRLKLLLNDPRFPVGGEVLLVPADEPPDAPIEYSLVDMVIEAMRKRPDIQRATLAIDDASIRQMVADNARLPMLDLSLRVRFAGLQDNIGDAYGDITDADFVSYLAGLAFEQPIGNRAAEARSRQRRLERVRAVVDHRATIQNAVLEIKNALRNLQTNFQLIEQTRTSRLAASENLRTLLIEEETLRALTPDFLDLKFRRQEALANAEIQEIFALVDYSVSLADLYRATGAALDRNRISFVVPDASELLRSSPVRRD